MPTAWNSIALVAAPKEEPAPSLAQRLLNSAQAIINKVSTVVRDQVSELATIACRWIKGITHSAGPIKSDFASEASRLGSLLDSMGGEPFVSSVCPPLEPSPLNRVAIIVATKPVDVLKQAEQGHRYARILTRIYSFVAQHAPFLIGRAAESITLSPYKASF